MKPTVKFIAFSCFIGSLFSSCYEDKGNYTYADPSEVSPIKIVWEEMDVNHVIGTPLTVEPQITGMDDPDNYDFFWLWYQSTGKHPDTLARIPKLENFQLYYDPGEYRLGFNITDKRNGYTVMETLRIIVSSEFSRGWVVAKSIDGATDIDFVRYDGLISENMILYSQGDHLEGAPVQVCYQNSYYSHSYTNEEGLVVNLTNQKAIHVITDKDLGSYNSSTMALYKQGAEWFWNAPEVFRPQIMFTPRGGFCSAFINDGLMYGIYSMADTRGKFAGRTYNGGYNYELSDFLYGYSYGPFVFDRVSRTFLTMSYAGSMLTQFDAVSGKHNNMDCDMVKWMPRARPEHALPTAYVVMRADNGQYRIYSVNTMGTTGDSFLSQPISLSSDSGLIGAPFYAAHASNEAIYFSSGNNELVRLTVPNGEERVIRTFAAGEKITALRGDYFYTPDGYSLGLTIATETAAGWKIYVFQYIGDTPELQAEPLYEFTGTGTIHSIEYIIS